MRTILKKYIDKSPLRFPCCIIYVAEHEGCCRFTYMDDDVVEIHKDGAVESIAVRCPLCNKKIHIQDRVKYGYRSLDGSIVKTIKEA